jgi:organic radical activating enzyme
MTKTYCCLAWNHHFIGPGGNCKPCCRFKKEYIPEDHNLENHSLEELFNSEFMNSIRNQMLDGKQVLGCKKCYDEEETNKDTSLRQSHNNIIEISSTVNIDKPLITFLELSYSNICDLQCVMCGPYFSTSWSKQDITNIDDLVPSYNRLDINLDTLIDVIPNVIYFKFTGGEPLLINDYQTLLTERMKYPNFEDCCLTYATNLMRFPKQDLLDIWEKVKFVVVSTSFDGTGKTIEYVRYPSKWNIIEENLIKYLQLSDNDKMSIRVGMRSTIMPYNILNILDMYDWWFSNIKNSYDTFISPTHVAQPIFLSLKVLPKECKEYITNELYNFGTDKINQSVNHLIQYMNSEDHTHLLDDFKRYTKVMDKRGITFEEIEPELFRRI